MRLTEQINAAIAEAMKARDQVRLDPLRMLKTALTNKAIEKGRELDDAEAQQVVTSLVKQRRDSIAQFTKGGRADLADKEAREIAILETYLPPALDQAELEQIIQSAITETGAASQKDLGRVMKVVMERVAGRGADGKLVNESVRRKLGG